MNFTLTQLYPYRKYFPKRIQEGTLGLMQLTSNLTKIMLQSKTLQQKLFLSNIIISLKTKPQHLFQIIRQIDRQEHQTLTELRDHLQAEEQTSTLSVNKKPNPDLMSTGLSYNKNRQSRSVSGDSDTLFFPKKTFTFAEIGINTDEIDTAANHQQRELKQLYQQIKQTRLQMNRLNVRQNELLKRNQLLSGQNSKLHKSNKKWEKKCGILEQMIQQAKMEMVHFEKVLSKGNSVADYYFGFLGSRHR